MSYGLRVFYLSVFAFITSTPLFPAAAQTPAIDAAINAARQPLDACGGRGLLDAIVPDGPFLEACKHHDACYRSDAKDQYACDMDFLVDMKLTCAADYPEADAPIKHHTCDAAAFTYFKAVNSKFGSYAYSRGRIGGAILSHDQSRIEERGGDELRICVTVQNTANRIQEYDLQLFDARGVWVDTEPDLHDANIQPGGKRELCVDSDGAIHRTWETVGDSYSVILRVDDPDRFGPFDDMIEVARLDCEKAHGVCRVG